MNQSLSAKRIVIALIALYAVSLQAFVAATVRPSVFESFGGAICVQDASVPASPTDSLHHHHGVCCILACAASGFAFVTAVCGLVVFAALIVAALVFPKTREARDRSPRKYYFAARGPPQSV